MLLNDNWFFEMDAQRVPVTLGHTWNAVDGQTAGKDPVPGRPDGAYRRGRFCYTRTLTVRLARGENVVACASSDGSAHDRIVLQGV